ncbi:MAG: hypothetical protein GEV11_04435 [Streptosporangiales bacterium]|nr:hypothetical protein [Streptosporangiales bacterium]
MRSAGEVLIQLARQYAFRDLAAVAAAGALPDGTRELAEVSLLCSFGQRLLDLDAEDFGVKESSGDEVADATAVPRALRSRARAARMPQTAKEEPRGALETLRPAYVLLLEAMEIRWRRRETTALVATAHIMSEYLPLLAWEPVLGHAGDPLRLHGAVAGHGSLFGSADGGSNDRACPHNGPQRAAASRSLEIGRSDGPRWRKYLDRRHSHIAGALGVCAAECHDPCTVITRLGAERNALRERCRLAAAFTDSPLVRLRHAAPVGHGFGVPSTDEVADAWERSRERLGERALGDAVLKDDGYVLPGLPSLISAVADAPIAPGTLIAEVSDTLVTTLTEN